MSECYGIFSENYPVPSYPNYSVSVDLTDLIKVSENLISEIKFVP